MAGVSRCVQRPPINHSVCVVWDATRLSRLLTAGAAHGWNKCNHCSAWVHIALWQPDLGDSTIRHCLSHRWSVSMLCSWHRDMSECQPATPQCVDKMHLLFGTWHNVDTLTTHELHQLLSSWAQHETSALSVTAGWQWLSMLHQSTVQHTAVCDGSNQHYNHSQSVDTPKALVQAFISSTGLL